LCSSESKLNNYLIKHNRRFSGILRVIPDSKKHKIICLISKCENVYAYLIVYLLTTFISKECSQ